MDVSSTTQSQTSSSSQNSTIAGGKSLSDTFDNFLVLLTTQLKNQDPLDPMDSAKFTDQLVSFSGVEQQIKTNDKLDQLLSGQTTNQAAQAVGFLGKSIEGEGTKVGLSNGSAPVSYELAKAADKVEILLTDSSGKTVRKVAGPTEAGRHDLVWDGTDDNGNTLPDGSYTIQVRAADADGKTVDATTYTSGTVTGVQTIDGILQLMIGDTAVPLDQVKSIHEPASA
ncbi:flagellar basal-body rod modification protein FlgD [Tistlia consotensis]|uniref:Basal-body rod modification protein FlgD n=1 Tax=Tistlia consotensis USBA 355 TaxID=560819 RepID=A0A1Y6CRF2_9PROT|nr:flagellar hook capping FlgD N-terminal domain-containing protein [Tistlia consotensis]SMF67722.1 flagellar basal-body rod modification protein FlgD [Tistlia consotensis USBA 355]SNR99624.1 flagellar basal-body rod modification protein FlgD [Tistlia consotensis]